MNKRYAMFPGTFDPPTLGHVDIIKRSAEMYEKVYVVVADNINKKTMFSAQERLEMTEEIFKDSTNIKVCIWDGLVVDFAKANDIGVIVRGVRALNDFSYEFELASLYKQMCPGIEVVLLPTSLKFALLRSSGIREMVAFGADISKLVPELVVQRVNAKIKC